MEDTQGILGLGPGSKFDPHKSSFIRPLSGTELAILNRESSNSESHDPNRAILRSL